MKYSRLSRKHFTLLSLFLIASTQLHFWKSVGRCDSYEIKPKLWDYKSRYDIGYEVATRNRSESLDYVNESSANEPILLLNGFGVGKFHQSRLVHELLTEDNDSGGLQRTIFCLDYLGQGLSWPKDCQDGLGENEENLQYSAET